MFENKSKSKALVYFIEFLFFIGAFGGIIALINKLLRQNGFDSPYIEVILLCALLLVYFNAWKWMCRKLDVYSSNNKRK